MKYYVYSISEPNSETPFYIGFSQNKRRPSNHITEAKNFINGLQIQNPNYIKLGILRRILEAGQDPVISFLFETENKQDALEEEIRLIAYYGRRCNNSGILSNLTAGGEGMRDNPDHWARGHTKETHPGLMKSSTTKKANPQIAWNKGLKGYGAGNKNNFYGKTHTVEFCSRLSDLAKTRTGDMNTNAKCYEFISPSLKTTIVCGELAKFCENNGLPKSSVRKIIKTGNTLSSGPTVGWDIKVIDNLLQNPPSRLP